MSPSVPVRAPRMARLALLTALAACTADTAFAPIEVRHPAAERMVHGDAVEVELTATRYLERGVAVSIVVRNRDDAPVQIGREGLLLGVADLEYPLDPDDNADLPSSVNGGDEVRLQLSFATGAPIDEGATLHLRALRRRKAWLNVPPLPIDPAPIAPAPAP